MSSDNKEMIEHSEKSSIDAHPTALSSNRDAQLAEALSGETLNPRSATSIKLYLMMIIAYCNSGSTGLDGTLMGGINAMAQFHNYFGTKSLGGEIGLIFSVYPIGQMIGTLFAAPLMDKFGRRWGMFVGSTIILIGTAILAAAQNKNMFIIGRCLAGVGVAVGANAAPSYVAEVSPAQWRGRLAGMYNTWYYVGSILATGIMVGTTKIDSTWAWRAPLAVQASFAGIVFVGVWFLPESPRWLIANGRTEEARVILAKYHTNANDANAPIVVLQIAETEERAKIEGAAKHWDLRPLFNTPAARYRSAMCLGMAVFGQVSGNGLITYFLPQLLANAGITSQSRQLTLTFVNSFTSFAGALTGVALLDRVGRRPLMMFSLIGGIICLAVVTGCTAEFEKSAAIANTGIAFVFLFMIVFSVGFTPLQPLYPAECLTLATRGTGMAMTTFVLNVASLFNTYAVPALLEKIGFYTYIIFIAWDVLELGAVYVWAVETKGRTLEELTAIFESPNPVKASLTKTHTN